MNNNDINMLYNEKNQNLQNNSTISNSNHVISNNSVNIQNFSNNNEDVLTLYDINQPKSVEDMPYIFCPSCNNRVIANSNFCSSCGNQISR